MAEPLETSFQKLTGRAPTEAERERLYRVKDALRLPDNDALWSLLIALDYHHSLYEQIPSRIAKLLEQVSVPSWWVSLLGGRTRFVRGGKLACLAAFVVGSLLIAAALGRNIGYAGAQQDLMDRYDLAAARWANSPEGRHARVLAYNGTLAWADSRQGRMLRELSSKGLLDSLWSRVGEEQLDVALVRRADAEWLASQAGQRARALSDDGTLTWLDSREGIMARRLIAAAPPDVLTAGADLAVVPRADAKWLGSEAGQHARTLSDDGTLVWGEWLQALVHNRLIAEVGKTPESPRCEGVSTMGFEWREHGDSTLGKFCAVWHGSITVNMDRIGQSRSW